MLIVSIHNAGLTVIEKGNRSKTNSIASEHILQQLLTTTSVALRRDQNINVEVGELV
jgi:hypothetical protein